MTPKIPAANKLAVLLAAIAIVAIGFDTPAGAQTQAADQCAEAGQASVRRPRPSLLRAERTQRGLSAGAAHPSLHHQALLA